MATESKKNKVNLSRRKMLKSTSAAGAAALVLTARKSSIYAQTVTEYDGPQDGFLSNAGLISPRTRPFVDELPMPTVLQPTEASATALTPEQLPPYAPYNPLFNAAEEERRIPASVPPFQAYDRFPPKKYYELRSRQLEHSFSPGNNLPANKLWGYTGTYPSMTLKARYGEPILVRHYNDLEQPGDFGIPHISPHLHNLHTPSDSDGFPNDFIYPGEYKDYHYPNVYAGVDQYQNRALLPEGYRDFAAAGDPREALGTLWYHDHRKDFTAQNTYKGLAGFYLLYDELDSGDENDPNPRALRLPGGKYDVPLVFHDKVFTQDGQHYFDLFNLDGVLGDKFCVNGVIQPYLNVERRKYRFRLLVPGPSRFYRFYFADQAGNQKPFTLISQDGNLLPAPIRNMTSIPLSVAERADIVIDFSQFPAGTQLYLENRLRQDDGRGPDSRNDVVRQGKRLLQFRVQGDPPAPDRSQVPNTLRALPTFSVNEAVRQRTWQFDRGNGAWTINGRFYDERRIAASIKKGSAEIWTLQNNSGGWDHPIHIHFEEFRILSRNGRPPLAHEQGRKDVVWLGRGEEIKIFVRFRDFLGRYVMHCHNTIHEDHAMMLRWDIVP